MSVITCYFCGASAADVDEAIEAGWYPSFSRIDPATGDHKPVDEQVCSACLGIHLDFDAPGSEPVLRDDPEGGVA